LVDRAGGRAAVRRPDVRGQWYVAYVHRAAEPDFHHGSGHSPSDRQPNTYRFADPNRDAGADANVYTDGVCRSDDDRDLDTYADVNADRCD
jgi:hypothetical protein